MKKNSIDIAADLALWIMHAPEGERQNRMLAAERIRQCINAEPGTKTCDELSLQRMGLSSVPPLPPHLRSLNLAENKITSLAGLPDEMPLLEVLDLDINALRTLDGLPDMPNLKKLSVAQNELATLDGFSDKTPKVEILDVSQNRLTSLEGLPTTLVQIRDLDVSGNQLTSLHHLPIFTPSFDSLNIVANFLTSLDEIPPPMLASRNIKIYATRNPLCERTKQTIASMRNQGARIIFNSGMENKFSPVIPPDIGYGAASQSRLLGDRIQALGVPLSEEESRKLQAFQSDSKWRAFSTFVHQLSADPDFHVSMAHKAAYAAARVDLKAVVEMMIEEPASREFALQLCSRSLVDNADTRATFELLRRIPTDPARREGATIEEILAFHRGVFREQLIDNYTAAQFPNEVGPSAAIALKILLQEKLALPDRYKGTIFPDCEAVAQASQLHMEGALAQVRDAESDAATFRAYLLDDPLWQRHVEHECVSAIRAHEEMWSELFAASRTTTVCPHDENRNDAHARPTPAEMKKEFDERRRASRAHLLRTLGRELMCKPSGSGEQVSEEWRTHDVQWQSYARSRAGNDLLPERLPVGSPAYSRGPFAGRG